MSDVKIYITLLSVVDFISFYAAGIIHIENIIVLQSDGK